MRVENALLCTGAIGIRLVMADTVFCDRNKRSSKVKFAFQSVDAKSLPLIQSTIEQEFPGHRVELIQTDSNNRHYGYRFYWGFTIRVHHDANVILGDNDVVVDMKATVAEQYRKQLRAEDAKERRSELIQQLRFALGQVESPRNDEVEFEIGDEDFSFDFSI